MKVYGSRAYLVLPKQRRESKLSPVTKMGYLIGYALKTKGYRVWIPSENRVEESIHVKFDESINYKMDNIEKKTQGKSQISKGVAKDKIDTSFDSDDDLSDEIKNEATELKSDEETEGARAKVEDEIFKTPEKQSDIVVRQRLSVPENIVYRRERVIGNKNRAYITYYPSPDPTVRLRNIYDVKKYCEMKGYSFNEDEFNFETKTRLQDIDYILDNADI